MPRPFALSRDEKLKSRKHIEQLFAEGQGFSVPPVRFSYRVRPAAGAGTVRVGVSATKRSFKKAVDRNRIKRLLREAYRLQKAGVLDLARQKGIEVDLFLIFTGRQVLPFAAVAGAVQQGLRRLGKKLEVQHENPA